MTCAWTGQREYASRIASRTTYELAEVEWYFGFVDCTNVDAATCLELGSRAGWSLDHLVRLLQGLTPNLTPWSSPFGGPDIHPPTCEGRVRWDPDLETLDRPRRGLTGARASLDRATSLA